MAFPTIQFKATNTGMDEKLQTLVESKFESLDKFLGDEDGMMCGVEFDKVAPHQSGMIFRVEANLTYKGKLFRAQATEVSFEEAIDEVRNELDKKLRRFNKKRNNLFRRGGRKIKKLLRFGP